MSYVSRLIQGEIGIPTLFLRDYLLLANTASLILFGSICPMLSIPLPPAALLITMIRLVIVYGIWMRASTFRLSKRLGIYLLFLPVTMVEVYFLFFLLQFIITTPFSAWHEGLSHPINGSISSSQPYKNKELT